MKIYLATFFLFAAMGAVATPIGSQPDHIDTVDDLIARFVHDGVIEVPSSLLEYLIPNSSLIALFFTRNAPSPQTNADTKSAKIRSANYFKCSTKKYARYRVSSFMYLHCLGCMYTDMLSCLLVHEGWQLLYLR